MDFVITNQNEREFLEKKKDLVFIYAYKKNFKPVFPFVFLSDKKLAHDTIYEANGNDRGAFERGVTYIYNLEASKDRDFIFSRRSGMNQVLAKIARDKDVTLIFSYSLFKNASNKAKVLGRMRHNMRLCEKYHVKYLVCSMAERIEDVESEIVLKAFERLLKKRKLF